MSLAHDRLFNAAEFRAWNKAERRFAPPLVVEVAGVDLHPGALLDFADGRAGVSLFKAEPRSLPLALTMVERHPDGSQCFIPMSMDPFLVIVAQDAGGAPGQPLAFETAPGQAVNFYRGTWHGVLTPLHAPGLFAVVDRIGAGANLEEHWFEAPFTVQRP